MSVFVSKLRKIDKLNVKNLLKLSKCQRYSSGKFNNPLIDIKPEILNALNNNGPIVALESTIITHGMPYPYNLETAINVENIVRSQGAIPATIGIINGRIKVGLSLNELEILANNANKNDTNKYNQDSCMHNTIKTSRRDLAYVLANNWNGGTTVAGTLIVSNLVGINVFATGGIGGVHRNGHITMDISADLIEIGKSPVAVVSSGIKSILDIPRTLEYLETQGVCVASFQGINNEFPAFYTSSSGVKAPYNFKSALDVAKAIKISLDVNLNSGFLIGVPVPEEFSMDVTQINNAIDNALIEADRNGIHGKEVTPFILANVSKITDGKSLETNMALIKNNAKIAAQIAINLSNLRTKSDKVIDNSEKMNRTIKDTRSNHVKYPVK